MKQINTILLRLQKISEEQDIANLVLLFKELIPDYNPGAELLKAALLIKKDHGVRAKISVLSVQPEARPAKESTAATVFNLERTTNSIVLNGNHQSA
jgi:hypothetical protein